MTDIVMGYPFDVAQSHRQHRLGAFESLDLTYPAIERRIGAGRYTRA
jgi:hypothetical protein